VLKKTLIIMLSGILLTTTFARQTVHAQTGAESQLTSQTRARVQKMGVGQSARVEVKLRDNTKLKGYVSATAADSFTVTDAKTGASRTVTYTDVTQVKKSGGGLSARMWLIIGGAATAAVIVGVTVIKPVLCDGGAGC
jgi:hypothetical protein